MFMSLHQCGGGQRTHADVHMLSSFLQSPGNNSITLTGVLVPHNSTTDLAVLSDLFTRYLNGESSPVVAKGMSTEQADGTAISWLSTALQALSLTVPLKDPTGEIAPIKGITIGDFVRLLPFVFMRYYSALG